MKALNVGIIGCGNILEAYMKGSQIFNQFKIKGCADLYPQKAQEAGDKYGIKAYNTVEDLLNDKDIELVINLTVPKAHGEVDKAILNSGKHVFSEKPLGVDLKEAGEVLELAEKKGLLVGCAPDTFMGGGLQTTIKLIEDGWVGDVFAVKVNIIGGGPDNWHPNPEFFFQPGAGPLLDIGPYYIHALIAMFGPVKTVEGVSFIGNDTRYLTSPPERRGDVIKVETPTTNFGIYTFSCGVKCNFSCSFDCYGGTKGAPIEIYGTEGTLFAAHPLAYEFTASLKLRDQEERVIPNIYPCVDTMRGLGVADMVCALESGRKSRVTGELGYHALDIMMSQYESSEKSMLVEVKSTCEKPKRLPLGLHLGEVDE